MSRERLEEIKSTKWENLRTSQIIHVKWLIEQAERVQELEKQILYLESTIESASKVTEELEEQNKELLEGLATIGNAIHEGEISGRGTDENLILEVVDKYWRNRNERG